jgi:hypothetical protein
LKKVVPTRATPSLTAVIFARQSVANLEGANPLSCHHQSLFRGTPLEVGRRVGDLL